MSRFDRQKILPGFGPEGQEKLSSAKVLVVGAGGLGCPALLYLAAAGVGTIGIADGDSVSESNLNRQTLFGVSDVGKPKAQTAASVLKQKYPDVNFKVIPEFLTTENCLEILSDYDLVLDGSDNFGTRYMINDACVLLGIPLVMGAIFQYEGQVSVFNFGQNPVNYRDIYPVPPKTNEIPNCSETGVLGVLPGIIGNLQAAEAIKLISGMREVLSGKMLFYNLKTCSFYEIQVNAQKDSHLNIPKDKLAFKNTVYNITCGLAENISWEKALDWAANFEKSKLIDIREPEEEPKTDQEGILKVPMSVLAENPGQLQEYENIMLYCQAGQRSLQLAEQLKKLFPEKKIFSVEGGVFHPGSPFKIQKT